MRAAGRMLLGLVPALLILQGPAFGAKTPLKLTGAYFAYSYDLNQLYGEDVEFEFLGFRISGRRFAADLTTRLFCVAGRVALAGGTDRVEGDEFWFSPGEPAGVLVIYGEAVEARYFGSGSESKPAGWAKGLPDLTLAKIQKSALYMTAQSIEISRSFDLYGARVQVFVEGARSVGFKKLNMTSVLDRRFAGFKLDKIWYNRTQGLITSVSHAYSREGRLDTRSRLYYEEHTLAKGDPGLNRQFDLTSTLNANFVRDLNLAFSGNYNSSNLWNMNAALTKKWSDRARARIDLAYNKPVQYRGEAWLGAQTGLALKGLGEFAIAGRVGSGGQFLGSLSYGTSLFKRLGIIMSSSFSRFGIFGSAESSKIWSGNISVTYEAPIFNLATDYFLNRDLVGHQNLSQPRLTLSLNPITLYSGLLTFRMSNIYIINESRTSGSIQRSSSDNLTFHLGAAPFSFGKTLSLRLALSLEQFMEASRRGFTSGGIIGSIVKDFGGGMTLEGFYSAQSRRKTEGWFVQGTTSQDLSLSFRVNRAAGVSGWASISYDPKRSEWRTAFADLSVRILGAWQFQALACYDFLFEKINNIDLYLIRDAGRFQLRFAWRSLSGQFVVGLMPK